MTTQQIQFMKYVRTKMFFSLRLKSPADEMHPVHIPSIEIDNRFFPYPKFKRKEEIQKLINDGELQVTTKKSFTADGTEYSKYYYTALKPGGFDLNLLDTKNIPDDTVTQTMLRNIQRVTLPTDAPSTPYFDLFLKYKSTYPRLFFTVDKFAQRVHTPISSFGRSHRLNLLIDGEPTSKLDVATMQPLLLGNVLFTAIGENDFSTWINEGQDIYLMLQDKAGLMTRKDAKKKFFEILFAKPDKSLQTLFGASNWITWINAFKSIQLPENPSIKYNSNGSRSYHSNLAWRLQTDEVKVMRKIWTELSNQQIPFLTVHDEVIVKQSDKDQAHEIMRSVLASTFTFFKISDDTSAEMNDNAKSITIPTITVKSLKTLKNGLKQKECINDPLESIKNFNPFIINQNNLTNQSIHN